MYANTRKDYYDQDVSPGVLALWVWIEVRKLETNIDDDHSCHLIHEFEFLLKRLLMRRKFCQVKDAYEGQYQVDVQL